jgi:DNA-directed RNA polymerase I subunit RPA43
MSVLTSTITMAEHTSPKNSKKQKDPEKKKKKRKHALVEDSAQNPSPAKKPKSTRLELNGENSLPIRNSHAEKSTARVSKSNAGSATKPSSQSSIFQIESVSLYVPIPPVTLQNPIPGICAEHFSPFLLKYDHAFRGIILAYDNVRFSKGAKPEIPSQEIVANDAGTDESLALSVAEYSTPFVWVDVDFLVLKPARNHNIEGWIVLQNESHLGLVCWNLVNASIPKSLLPKDWTWKGPVNKSRSKAKLKADGKTKKNENSQAVAEEQAMEEQGYYVDDLGLKVEGILKFTVSNVDASYGPDRERNYMSIDGTLIEETPNEENV